MTGAYQVGGLVGQAKSSSVIVPSFATGDVVATGGSGSFPGVGGLVGRFNGQLTDSYATGSVRASVGNEGSSHHRRLVGAVDVSNALIATSSAIGSVTGPGAAITSGLAGAESQVPSLKPAESSFRTTQTSGQERSATGIGIRKTTAELANIATFTGTTPAWNIVDGWAPFDPGAGNAWGICPALNDGDPFLLWEYTEEQIPVACGGTLMPRVERTDTSSGASTPVRASVVPLDGGGPVAAGAHTLQRALPTASGMQAVNVGVTLGGPVPASAVAGEGPAVPGWLLTLGLFAAGGVMAARRGQAVAASAIGSPSGVQRATVNTVWSGDHGAREIVVLEGYAALSESVMIGAGAGPGGRSATMALNAAAQSTAHAGRNPTVSITVPVSGAPRTNPK